MQVKKPFSTPKTASSSFVGVLRERAVCVLGRLCVHRPIGLTRARLRYRKFAIGSHYHHLPTRGQAANLARAIECFTEALRRRTKRPHHGVGTWTSSVAAGD